MFHNDKRFHNMIKSFCMVADMVYTDKHSGDKCYNIDCQAYYMLYTKFASMTEAERNIYNY